MSPPSKDLKDRKDSRDPISLADIFGLAQNLVTRASERKVTIGTAESCTGGLLGAAITAISGASIMFKGGITAYANDIKINNLDVPANLINTHGAVSAEVASVMAQNARQILDVDYALSVTGIAGPGGGSEAKPVGTVFMGLAHPDGVDTLHFLFSDMRRNTVRDHSVYEALKALLAVI